MLRHPNDLKVSGFTEGLAYTVPVLVPTVSGEAAAVKAYLGVLRGHAVSHSKLDIMLTPNRPAVTTIGVSWT